MNLSEAENRLGLGANYDLTAVDAIIEKASAFYHPSIDRGALPMYIQLLTARNVIYQNQIQACQQRLGRLEWEVALYTRLAQEQRAEQPQAYTVPPQQPAQQQ